MRRRLRFANQVPMVLVSAKSGQRVLRILELIDEAHAAAGIRVPTAGLNRWLEEHGAGEPTARSRGAFHLLYGTQTGIHPPTFVLFCNDPARLHFSGRRQLENSLRDRFGFGAAPIRLRFRGREGGRPRRTRRGASGAGAEGEGETP
jgi:GTP-binding protein